MGQTTQRGIKDKNVWIGEAGILWCDDVPCEEPFGHRTILNVTDDEFIMGFGSGL